MKLSKFFTKALLTLLLCSCLTPTTSSATFWSQWSKKQTIFAITSATIGISGLMYLLYSHYTKNELPKKLFDIVRFGKGISNQRPEVLELIENGVNINAIDNNAHTPLYYACKNYIYDIADLLLQYGAASTHSEKQELLYFVLTQQNTDIQKAEDRLNTVKILVKHGALTEATKDYYRLASMHDLWDVYHFLINLKNTFIEACKNGSLDTVKKCINDGAYINTQYDDNRCTALHYACENGHLEIVEILIKHGAIIHAEDNVKQTPLYYACKAKKPKIVQLLIENGACINNDSSPLSPLHITCESGEYEITKLLLTHGAIINTEDDNDNEDMYKQSLLHIACKNNHLEIVKLLIQYNANINIQDNLHHTPLYYVCEANNPEIVSLLLTHGAIINAHNNNTKDNNGNVNKQSLLHIACKKNYLAIVKLLIQHGADMHAENSNKKTPLTIAQEHKDQQLAHYLINLETFKQKFQNPATARFANIRIITHNAHQKASTGKL